ncbi:MULTISPECIES: hypothetical protein [unclassified Paludibacterium]|uniref:hypothetical protein n=1 Tax=unclassified Paludibacterium TaxID=2618429 RepID=UPI001C04A958|nr:hypothetical protein [Paludibacterium sp. B53371]BEV71574.1 hypothetical protein THUN1379_10560 [Paludibacterium sp. THUN1379]
MSASHPIRLNVENEAEAVLQPANSFFHSMFDPIPSSSSVAAERLDAEVLSTLRSLISGFASLQRAIEATRRYSQTTDPQVQGRALARWQLLATIHPLLKQYIDLGVAPGTLLHDVPLLVPAIRQAEAEIRERGEFGGWGTGR